MIEIKSFSEKGLPFLGSGSDRRVYALPDGKHVLKVSKTKRGILQNQNECRISETPEAEGVVAKVTARSKGYKYIVMERAEPVNFCGNLEFVQLLVIDTHPSTIAYRWWKELDLYEVEKGIVNGKEVLIDYGMTCKTWNDWYERPEIWFGLSSKTKTIFANWGQDKTLFTKKELL